MHYFNLRRANENQTSVRPKRRWPIYVGIGLFIVASQVSSIIIYDKITGLSRNVARLKEDSGKTLSALRYIVNNPLNIDDLTEEKEAKWKADLEKILGLRLYQMEFTITYPRK